MRQHQESQRPALEMRRAMLERKRDELRAKGFDAELEIASLTAQQSEDEKDEEQKQTLLAGFKSLAANSYAGAKEMSRLLSELPKAKPEKATA